MNGKEMHDLMTRLFPLPRSLTGNGVRQTLAMLKEIIPLELHEVPSGTKVFDWTVPDEWNLNRALLTGPERFITRDVVGYSIPSEGYCDLEELKTHLHSLPDQPLAVPYVTSYYEKCWGFCLSHRDYMDLDDGEYSYEIDADLKPGSLTYADLVIPGETDEEIFFSTYCCHPQMANNELSGPVVMTALAKWIALKKRRYTYRLFIGPETIGAVCYLASDAFAVREKDYLGDFRLTKIGNVLSVLKQRLKAGWVMTCLGGPGDFTVQAGRTPGYPEDISRHVLMNLGFSYRLQTWDSRASDERQYCAPGVGLPVCSVQKTAPSRYKEYHTDQDNLDFVKPAELETSLAVYRKIVECLEADVCYRSTVTCEPFMTGRGLYPALSKKGSSVDVRDLMTLLSYCDGETSLLTIATRMQRSMWELRPLVSTLLGHELVDDVIPIARLLWDKEERTDG